MSLLNSLHYMHPAFAAASVLNVFRQNEANDQYAEFKSSADTWATYSVKRAELFLRVRLWWCFLTGMDASYFPYSEDGTARLYFRFRKRNAEEITAFMAELSASGVLPEAWHRLVY